MGLLTVTKTFLLCPDLQAQGYFICTPKACEHKPRQTELLRHRNQKPHIFKVCCIGLQTITAQKTRNVPLTQNPLVPFQPSTFILKWPTASALLQQSISESILGLDGCAPAGHCFAKLPAASSVICPSGECRVSGGLQQPHCKSMVLQLVFLRLC